MCVLLSSGLAVADDTVPPVADDMAPPVAENMVPVVSQHHFAFGLVVNHFEYEEPDVDVTVDGFMGGVIGSYTHHDKNKLMVHASLELSYGSLDYDGQTWGGIPVKEDSDDWIVEGRFLFGHDYYLRGPMGYRGHFITPYIGLGLRCWYNDTEGRGGYAREVRYWYFPIGMKINGHLSDHWTCTINAEYDFFLGGRVKSRFSDIHPGYNDPAVDQDIGEGYGCRFSLGFTRKLDKTHAVALEPYITYWHIDESDIGLLTFHGMPDTYIIEPANKTTSYGLRIGLEF